MTPREPTAFALPLHSLSQHRHHSILPPGPFSLWAIGFTSPAAKHWRRHNQRALLQGGRRCPIALAPIEQRPEPAHPPPTHRCGWTPCTRGFRSRCHGRRASASSMRPLPAQPPTSTACCGARGRHRCGWRSARPSSSSISGCRCSSTSELRSCPAPASSSSSAGSAASRCARPGHGHCRLTCMHAHALAAS